MNISRTKQKEYMILDLNREIWRQQSQESNKAYEAFCFYMKLGPARNRARAWEQYAMQHNILLRPADRGNRGRLSTPLYFGTWCKYHRWKERAMAYDDDVFKEERAKERANELHWRTRMVEEARTLREAGNRIWSRFIEFTSQGVLDKVVLDQIKTVTTLAGTSGSSIQKTRATTDLIKLMDLGLRAIDTGQSLERVANGQPADIVEVQSKADTTMRRLLSLMKEYVPPEAWDETIEALERTGKPVTSLKAANTLLPITGSDS